MLYFTCNRKHRSYLYDSIGNIVCQCFVWGGLTVDAQCRKAYVSVNVDIDEEGAMHPRAIRWRNGHSFRIERVLYKCRASSNKVGGGGIRYTVQINGQEKYLFNEGSKWFVEAKI